MALIVDQSYTINDNAAVLVYGLVRRAQAFTPSLDHYARFINAKCYRLGVATRARAFFQGAVGGLPDDGDILATSDWLDVSALGAVSPGVYIQFWFPVPAFVLNGTQYTMVLEHDGGDGSNGLYWRVDTAASIYPGGDRSSFGAGWSITAGSDHMFQEGYDDSYVPPASGVIPASSLGSRMIGEGLI
jgi:hypothetical protein